MVALENLTLGYGDKGIIENGSAEYSAGASHAVIGRNGSGKSTLLKAVACLKRVKSGSISISGADISSMQRHRLGKEVSFVTTEKFNIPKFTCRDIVCLGRAPYTDWIGRLSVEDRKRVDRALDLVDMTDFAGRRMDTLSDGECQRVMIARAIAQDTPVILLDEPTSFLDLPNRYALCSLLQRLAHEEGKCIIFSSHELDIVMKMADTVTLIDNKKLTHLPVCEMRESSLIKDTFGITF